MFYKDKKSGIAIHSHGLDNIPISEAKKKAQKHIDFVIKHKVFERYFSDDYVDADIEDNE